MAESGSPWGGAGLIGERTRSFHQQADARGRDPRRPLDDDPLHIEADPRAEHRRECLRRRQGHLPR